ncbi:MAG: DNA ligase D [Alphaproteobacteria bacterium]|nr:DNA ligase D [Alphaproteobacteria bacterium]MBL6939480.1 DNA ligase D [Alphaproteobacteria bacterium]MBL7097039.1 DNA ligase D [Alphaproteobacteria bacterium]
MPSDLKRYHAKRKFDRTPEPKGSVAEESDAPMFCVQQHHARRMHYDLRLQIGGTLRSWAVPEGPCLDPKVRRFAKLTEDHPLEYLSFEGAIPDGNYGAGNMIVWDRGTWVTLADDPDEALKNGELKFRLAGEKLSGGWTLVQLPDDPTNFLLIKERDIAARPLADYDVLKEEPNSVITGKPVDDTPVEAAPPKKAASVPKAGKLADAKAAPFPAKWSPELASQADAAPRGKGWLHEIKYDGYRTLVFFDHGKVTLITRNGHDWTKRYGALSKAFAKLPCETAILDGEIVVQDARGISSLNLLEEALSDGGVSHTFTFFAFDLCYLDGHDLSGVTLIERKRALEGLVTPLVDARSAVQLSSYVEGDGQELFTQASRMGLEGIVSKKADSRYVQKRSSDWVKVKRVEIGTFTVIGFLSSAPKTVTSLVLAEERGGELVYACRAGSGLSETRGRELYPQFAKVEIARPVVTVPKTPDAHWIEPNWTIELGYRSRSSDNAPRAPVFMSIAPVKKRPAGRKSLKPKLIGDKELASIHLTNPDRGMFAGSADNKLGVTKLDIALYYARVGDWLLPELLRRPVTIIRCPTGDINDLFYQRHAFHGLPDGVEKVELKDEEGRAAFITVTEPKGYLGLPQFGAVEFHLWGCRVDDPEHPDRIVMDLDPDESLPWARVCDGAEILRDRMKALGFGVFLRTTGGKGLHLVTAIDAVHDWAEMKSFAEALAKAAAADSPGLFTAVASKERRKGKIYIDYLRNGRGASAIASYSLRARLQFPVATPIRWDELRNLTNGMAFNRQTVFKRLETLAADPWDGLESSAIRITPQMRRAVGLKK